MQELPPAPAIDHTHAKLLRNWSVQTDQEALVYPEARLYGQIVYAPHHVGHWIYAYLYESSTQVLIGSWGHEPINGRTALVKQCACHLSHLCHWPQVIALRQSSQPELEHEVPCALIAQVNTFVRDAGGRSVLACPHCAERFKAMLYHHP